MRKREDTGLLHIYTMESVYITEYNKNGVSFHELSLGQYDSDRDYLRDSDRASGGSIRGGDSVFEGGSESVRGDGWGYGTLGGDDADRREVRTSGGDGAENAAGAELSVSGNPRQEEQGTGYGLEILRQTVDILNSRNKNKMSFIINDRSHLEPDGHGTLVSIIVPFDYTFEL